MESEQATPVDSIKDVVQSRYCVRKYNIVLFTNLDFDSSFYTI